MKKTVPVICLAAALSVMSITSVYGAFTSEEETQTSPWASELSEDDFVTAEVNSETENLDLFEEYVFESQDEEVGELTYYVYDPVKNGADENKTYPIIMWFHGKNNGLEGKLAINRAGAELYASPEYQEEMGGAYIICPVANEKMDEDGNLTGHWETKTEDGTTSIYSETLKNIMDSFVEEHKNNVGKIIIAGTSAGGYEVWRYMIDYTEDVDCALLISPAYLPTEEELDKIDKAGIRIWYMTGYHDEILPFEEYAEPNIVKYLRMENMEVTVFDWVRSADHGVASMYFGTEMGQHCLCAQVGHNLIYADGTPYDISHPEGVTGWIKSVAE